MEILSSHRSRHTPARRSAPPHSLARTIARDETNMSTFECTRKLPQHEYALVLSYFHTFIYLKHLYIFIEKGKKSFITIFKEVTIFICFSKTPPFSRPKPVMVHFHPTTSYRSVGIGVGNNLHFIFLLKTQNLFKTCTRS